MSRHRSLLIASLALLACEPRVAPVPVEPVPAAVPTVIAPRVEEPSPPLTQASLYDLPIQLTDQTGTTRSLAAFRGSPVLVTMFYGSCAAACPLLTSDLKRIERQLPAAVRSEVRVLMVSFDQARDTPPVLARLVGERGMDPARWTLASANEDDARSLAGVLGIRYRKLDNGEFFHSSVVVLLDREGRPRVRLDGLGKDAAPIVDALSKAHSPNGA
jgi:protein SCO1/2